MKHLKTFEATIEDNDHTKPPQPGDYVICEEENSNLANLEYFLENNIGQFIKYRTPNDENVNYRTIPNKHSYIVQYHNPKPPLAIINYFKYSNRYNNCRFMSIDEIKYWSPNKKELENILEIRSLSNKFNI